MATDTRKPIDAAMLDGMRQRIDVARIIDRLQACVDGDEPMRPEQVKAAETLLRKVMPDLKAIEHSGEVRKPETREEMIERLTAIHRATTAKPVNGTAIRADNADGTDPTQH